MKLIFIKVTRHQIYIALRSDSSKLVKTLSKIKAVWVITFREEPIRMEKKHPTTDSLKAPDNTTADDENMYIYCWQHNGGVRDYCTPDAEDDYLANTIFRP